MQQTGDLWRRWFPARGTALDDVDVDLTLMVFGRGLLLTVLLASTSIVGSTAVLAHRYNDPWLWHLAYGMTVVCIVRVGIVIAFSRQVTSTLTPSAARMWHRAYGISTLFYTSTMGTVTIYGFSHHYDFTIVFVCTIGVFAFCGGINTRLGVHPWAANASGLIMLVSLALAVLRSQPPLVPLIVLLICAYSYFYVQSTKVNFDIVVRQIRSERRLRELSERDSLTGLANRLFFRSALTEACRRRTSFAILFIDLDRFKAVNDTFGHAIGDQLLQSVAQRLRETISSSDLLARLGGDEFAILHLQDASSEQLAARINREISTPFEIEGHRISIGASIGIKLSTPSVDANAEELLSIADAALYSVKRNGGDGFSFVAC